MTQVRMTTWVVKIATLVGLGMAMSGSSVLRADRGCAWTALENGPGPGPLTLSSFTDVSGTHLYAGGQFSGFIKVWNGTTWSLVGGGTNGNVNALAVYNGELYAGGLFTQAGGSSANHVARWNGTSWSAVDSGVNDSVQAMAVYNGELYVGGSFTSAGGVPASRIARWNGSAWSSVGSGLNNIPASMEVFAGELHVGGEFTMAGGVSGTSRIAKWNGTAWLSVGGGLSNAYVASMAVFDDGSGSALYAATPSPNSIQRWDGSTWTVIGQTNFPPLALAAIPVGEGAGLYAGGNFTSVIDPNMTTVAATYIGRWNGMTWTAVGAGVDNQVNTLHSFYDGTGHALYVGGFFTTAGGAAAPAVARWLCGCCEGSNWSLVSTSGPSGRVSHAMSYDSSRHVTVLFGGVDATGTKGDTWEWDGKAWTLRPVSFGPSARTDSAMAYDSLRNVTVLFGGVDATGIKGDTWEWDGSNWTLITLSGPTPRSKHAMAYDSARGRVVMFGGTPHDPTPGPITWEWRGGAWSAAAEGGPAAREGHAMAFDAARGETVLFGGTALSSGGKAPPSDLGDTWEWNGARWVGVSSSGPAARRDHAMTYLGPCIGAVLFGGSTGSDETWTWNGAFWSRIGAGGPGPLSSHAMVFDTLRHALVVFGGDLNRSETWEFWCPCLDEEAAPLDPNGQVIFPPDLDPNEPIVEEEIYNMDVGSVNDIYTAFDTTTDDWYADFPCGPALGGMVDPNASNPDIIGQLEAEGITGVTIEELNSSFTSWQNQISTMQASHPNPLPTAPPVSMGYTRPAIPHCTVPGRKYVFGGRDLVFIHGLISNALWDKILDPNGSGPSYTTWPQDQAGFYTGYWKQRANSYWRDHINTFLRNRGIVNRYLVVSWPETQRLDVAVQAVLAQISEAMLHGTGVVDPLRPTGPLPNDFGTPSYVIVSHSTGMLIADAALSAADSHPSLNAKHVADYCKAHVAFHGADSGSQYATGIAAAALGVAPATQWLCPLTNKLLRGFTFLGGTPPALNCPNVSAIFDSVLVDLVPLVAQNRWGPYVDSNPVRTVTVIGGHPTILAPLKNVLASGFDDGVLTINSQVGNPSSALFWPSGYYPSLPFGRIKMFDMGVNLPRAIGYYIDQTFNPLPPALPLLVAGGATPWLSPTGMLQPVGLVPPDPWNPRRRYTRHYSFLQSASDHFADSSDQFFGYHGDKYRDSFGTYLNREETRVITDPAIYTPYPMQYPNDGQAILTTGKVPQVTEVIRGRKVGFTIRIFGRKISKSWWIWKRRYHLLKDWESKVEADYVYDTVLLDGGYPCPPADWSFSGVAEGGSVSATITGPAGICEVTVTTTAGQTAQTVAANVAAAINTSSCLSGQGITATVQGTTVLIGGIAEDDLVITVSDPGIMPNIPTLGTWGLVLFALALLTMATLMLARPRVSSKETSMR